MNEAEYVMKNYGGLEVFIRRYRDLNNSSYDTKAEFSNCFIIHSK